MVTHGRTSFSAMAGSASRDSRLVPLGCSGRGVQASLQDSVSFLLEKPPDAGPRGHGAAAFLTLRGPTIPSSTVAAPGTLPPLVIAMTAPHQA